MAKAGRAKKRRVAPRVAKKRRSATSAAKKRAKSRTPRPRARTGGVGDVSAAQARIEELTHDLSLRVDSLQTCLDLVPVGVFITRDPDSKKIEINRYAAKLLGEEVGEGGPWVARTPLSLFRADTPVPLDERVMQRCARTGMPVPPEEAQVRCADGTFADVIISAAPLRNPDGSPRGAIAAVLDITERKRAEASQEILIDELQHRVKNVLATVNALAARLMKGCGSLDEFAKAFRPRLAAMAAVHELLSYRRRDGADLRALVEAALAPYISTRRANVSLDGGEVVLRPNAASTIGMALHELATNAVKYGALSDRKGRVEVSWQLEDRAPGKRLTLRWIERDGPAVDSPGRKGFGTNFVERSIGYELDGNVQMTFEPLGFACEIDVPLGGNVTMMKLSAAEGGRASYRGGADDR